MKLYQWRPELRMWLVLRAEERAIREVQPVEDQRRDLEPGPLQILVDACGQSALNELEEVRDKAARRWQDSDDDLHDVEAKVRGREPDGCGALERTIRVPRRGPSPKSSRPARAPAPAPRARPSDKCS